MIIRGEPNSTGSPSPIRMRVTVPARGEGIWFIVFIASTIIRVCPSATLSPTETKLGDPGSGAFDHIAFRAKESDVLIARLKEQGYPFRERQVPDMDLFQVFVDDPNGITVELNYWAEDQKAA